MRFAAFMSCAPSYAPEGGAGALEGFAQKICEPFLLSPALLAGTMTDDALLAAAQAGDRAALERLLLVHRHGVCRYGLKVCRTTEDAEDAVQETLWAATRAIRVFRGGPGALASWLFTIVRRECFRLFERWQLEHRADADADQVDPLDIATSIDDEVAARRRGELLAAALAELDPLHREAILLRDVRGLSAPEAATQLGISVDALKSRLHRARAKLREHVVRARTHRLGSASAHENRASSQARAAG
jgi:RNA polymerase sigma-70 factor (ECF subfamily)